MKWIPYAVGVCVVCSIASASMQDVALYKKESFLPDVVVVKRTMSDAAQICAERDGLMDCRSVGELRRWLQERKLK